MIASVASLGLRENENIISAGMASFVEVGEALGRIRDQRQYVDAGFDDFPTYCKERWALSESGANERIAAARTTEILVVQGLPAPPTLEAAKPLAKLYNSAGGYVSRGERGGEITKPEEAKKAVTDAWQVVVARNQEHSTGDKPRPITGKDVARVTQPPANAGKPGWFELVGKVGDHLIAAGAAMDKADDAVTRQPNQKLQGKLAEYAEWARRLADRLDAMREWQQ